MTTWAQFHQCSTYIFYACRSRKTVKLLIERWWNWPLESISPTYLCTAFMRADLKSAKRQSSHQCLFALLRSVQIKTTINACKIAINFIFVLRGRFSYEILETKITKTKCNKRKLRNSLSYEKDQLRTLLKLTPVLIFCF